ncbi:putative transcription factor kapC [Podospora aff. communis PSN243]|uniref:Putative transcription factor kapC n=1 Tax=Podospora aff. communis PSN243 TaxID=3040156 RepID=A0AAV9GRG7_9PEZI|nr:putative transcription factor kapC [Podospora aff. communis PSN243]
METATRDPPGGPIAASSHAANQTTHTASGFASHSRSPSDGQGGGQGSPIAAAHTLPHGYNHAPPAQNEAYIHPELRSADAVPTSSAYPAVPIPNMMPAASLSPSDQPAVMPGPTAAIGVAPGGVDHGDYSAEGRKAKRELSQSKRAAQNRAAQRAFRQRKEGYIKKLEQQVREFGEREANYKTIEAENHALRDYVMHLQSLLLDTKGEYPPPPANVNLGPSHGLSSAFGSDAAPTAAGPDAIDVAAQAVAGLNRSDQLAGREYKYENRDDDERTAQELTRQLADSTSDALPSAPM